MNLTRQNEQLEFLNRELEGEAKVDKIWMQSAEEDMKWHKERLQYMDLHTYKSRFTEPVGKNKASKVVFEYPTNKYLTLTNTYLKGFEFNDDSRLKFNVIMSNGDRSRQLDKGAT